MTDGSSCLPAAGLGWVLTLWLFIKVFTERRSLRDRSEQLIPVSECRLAVNAAAHLSVQTHVHHHKCFQATQKQQNQSFTWTHTHVQWEKTWSIFTDHSGKCLDLNRWGHGGVGGVRLWKHFYSVEISAVWIMFSIFSEIFAGFV